uniref:Uncharacterized protein n=1 Tax=Theropithecus gelada TaxID=9565 RepID=A0A8D2FC61_THEGE
MGLFIAARRALGIYFPKHKNTGTQEVQLEDNSVGAETDTAQSADLTGSAGPLVLHHLHPLAQNAFAFEFSGFLWLTLRFTPCSYNISKDF